MSEHILAIDNGTQSLRALIFDLKGQIVAGERVVFNPYESPCPGWAEQDPQVYWDALCQACAKLWTKPGVRKEALAGVSVTTQRGTVVNMDRNGAPLRPAILWLDNRRVEPEGMRGPLKWLFRLAGLRDTVNHMQANAESNWISAHQPDVWKETHKFSLLSGYLNHRLTGRFADSIGSQVGYLPFNYKKGCWYPGDNFRWDMLSLEPRMMVDLVPQGDILGRITDAAAEATGIPKSLPVVAGAADKACEILGSGSLTPDIGCISYGTTATISTISPKYLEITPFIPPYPAAAPDHYSPEFQIFRGYWMVSWFKEEFAQLEAEQAELDGVVVEKVLEDMIRDIQPGCDGLMLQPYWTPGVRVPGPEARGTVIGWNDSHGRAHLYRAVLEGIAYALRDGKERLEKRGNRKLRSLRVSGGGAQSEVGLQITADIFNLPTTLPHTYETSGLGAAIIAAVGLGLQPDFPTAVKEMTHVGRTFEPVPPHQRRYDQLYREVYLKMYGRLKPLYQALQRQR